MFGENDIEILRLIFIWSKIFYNRSKCLVKNKYCYIFNFSIFCIPKILYSCEDSSRECDNNCRDSSNQELQSILIDSGQDMIPGSEEALFKTTMICLSLPKIQKKKRKGITNIVLQINNKYWNQPDQFEMIFDEFVTQRGCPNK